eukprot:4839698-Heterocapsa_arctica.AAC.1
MFPRGSIERLMSIIPTRILSVQASLGSSHGRLKVDMEQPVGTRATCWLGRTASPMAPSHLTRLFPVCWWTANATRRPIWPCLDPSVRRAAMGMLS